MASYLQHLVRLYWIPTLDSLRAARRPTDRRMRPSADALRSLNEGIRIWNELGDAFKLDEGAERTRLVQDNFESNAPYSDRFLGCFTTDCPCHGRKSLHGYMHVCRGCWRAVYCGPQCQTRLVVPYAMSYGLRSHVVSVLLH